MVNGQYTVLIAGPLHKNMLENMRLNEGLDFVVSTWVPKNEREALLLHEVNQYAKSTNVRVVINETPDTSNVYNVANLYLQVCSVLGGVEAANEQFIVKCRSDEYFSNLNIIIKYHSTAGKPVTSNIFVRENDYCPFHISDHLLVVDKINFKQALKDVEIYLRESKDTFGIFRDDIPAEVKIAIFLLSQYGYDRKHLSDIVLTKASEGYQIMEREFELFDVDALQPYSISSSAVGEISDLRRFVRWDIVLCLKYMTNISDMKHRKPLMVYLERFSLKLKIFVLNLFRG